MRIKRSWTMGIGVVACVGAALWMRELASWRPVVVWKVDFMPTEIRFSGDGQNLLIEAASGYGAIFNVESGGGNTDDKLRRILEFDKTHGEQEYPRLSFDERAERVIFETEPQKKVVLHGLGIGRDIVGIENGKSSRYGWSQSRREVYGELNGEIWIWDAESGKLKKRVRYAKSSADDVVFSPDGNLFLAVKNTVEKGTPWATLNLYSTFNGQLMAPQIRHNEFRDFGFSPDGRLVWFAGSNTLEVLPTGNGEVNLVFSADSQGPVKWLPDGRLGIVEANGFRWRNAKGETIEHLPGPFQPQITKGALNEVIDWVLSNDGKWIYSAEQSGVIRRWRAR